LPYRDAFDHKPPGIFALHALAMALFGEGEWPIRVADVAGVLALGVCCWLTLSRRPRGALGLSCLACSLFYYGFYNFWDTAQCELWSTMFAIAAIAAAQRGRPFGAGVLAGAAVLFKTPALLFVAIALGVVWAGGPRNRARHVAHFVGGLVLLPAATALYFAARGGLAPMAEALGGATWAYVIGGRLIDSYSLFLRRTVGLFGWFNPYASFALAAVAFAGLLALSRKDSTALRRYRLAMALALAAYLGIVAQLKFYHYHSTPVIPALVILLGETLLWVREHATRSAMTVAVAALVGLFPLSGEPARVWWAGLEAFAQWATGSSTRVEVNARLAAPAMFYDPVESARVADWLREHTTPSERVLVRGHLPEIYILAHRRAPGRFFWTMPFTDRTRAYRVDEWQGEDRAAIVRDPPTYVVCIGHLHEGPESAEYFYGLGYVPEVSIGGLVIVRRDKGARL
jgi:hypothetical protein